MSETHTEHKKIDAEIKKITSVLNQKLIIPDYQRPYRWNEGNVRQLLVDIHESWKSGKNSYRVGSVILHESKDDILNIVDGQQRVTTILLILNVLRSDVGKVLCSTLKYNHNESKNRIVKNRKYISSWINENLNNEENEFSEYLTSYCEFVEIKVKDLSEAFQMFDSQNGTGKELEAYNLLKAYHIRAMENDFQETKVECDRRWEGATRFKQSEKENTFDILQQIFNEQLYRTREWSRKLDAYKFSKKKISEFKGITIDKHHAIKYPYQNNLLLKYIVQNYLDSIGAEAKGVLSRINSAKIDNIDPFVLINQNVINGKAFFDYIETYVEIYKQLFRNLKENDHLREFKEFYYKYCFYSGSHREGDKYLKELYKSLIFITFDKYGEDGVMKFSKTLYALVYRLRLEKYQVKYDFIAKYPSRENLFSIIEESTNFLDFQVLEIKAKQPIVCVKDVPIISQLLREYGIDIVAKDPNVLEINQIYN